MIYPSKEFLELFKSIPGALSVAEAIAIMNISTQAPKGEWYEYGTYKGKSALAAAHPIGLKPSFTLVDPEFSDDEWANDVAKYFVNAVLIADYSTNIIPLFNNCAYVFVDSGSHGDGLPMQEVKLLEDRMMIGGVIAFHDLLSQFTEVTEAYYYLIATGKYEEIKINWQEIFDYVKEYDLETNNNSWHQYPELPHPPNFVGALKRK